MWQEISIALNVLFLIGGILCIVLRRAHLLVCLWVLSLSVANFPHRYGAIVWTPSTVMELCSLLYLFFDGRGRARLFKKATRTPFLLVFAIMAMSLFIAFAIEPSTSNVGAGLQGRNLRPIVQAFRYMTYLSLFGLTILSVHSVKDIKRLLWVYSACGVFSAVVGWAQMGCYITGLPFKPILRPDTVSEIAVFRGVGTAATYRLYAFAGEPKTLAIQLMPVLIASLLFISTPGSANTPRFAGLVIAVVAPVFIFTFSTAAILAFGLALVTLVFAASSLRKVSLFRGVVVLSFAFALVRGLHSYLSVEPGRIQTTSIGQMILDRSVGRLEREWETNVEGRALRAFLEGSPLTYACGFGIGMYVYHVPGWVGEAGVRPIRSSVIAVLCDFGVLGLMCVASLLWQLFRRAMRMADLIRVHNAGHHLVHLTAIGGGVGAACLATSLGAFTVLAFFCGILVSSCHIASENYFRCR